MILLETTGPKQYIRVEGRPIVFLVRNNNADSWSAGSFVYKSVFASREGARAYIGTVAEYFADPEKEIEPYFTILEVPLNE